MVDGASSDPQLDLMEAPAEPAEDSGRLEPVIPAEEAFERGAPTAVDLGGSQAAPTVDLLASPEFLSWTIQARNSGEASRSSRSRHARDELTRARQSSVVFGT